ncbi:MAG: transposase, partial [Lamprobacter sp.]|uniref:transposase n=1 Tax=Lamprobacter sp. TaxID=3100796 RepID=UPI002B261721
TRLAAIAEAKRQIEARAAERFAREQAAYEAKLAARAAKAAARGRKPGGKAPKAPSPEPRAEDQINLTDAESRIMHIAGGGFEQCYNAQALVDTESMLVMVAQVTQAANDKEQVAPLIEGVQALPEGLNHPEEVIADNGYFSEHNVELCEAAGVVPLIAMKRDEHHPHWSERFSEPAALTL